MIAVETFKIAERTIVSLRFGESRINLLFSPST